MSQKYLRCAGLALRSSAGELEVLDDVGDLLETGVRARQKCQTARADEMAQMRRTSEENWTYVSLEKKKPNKGHPAYADNA